MSNETIGYKPQEALKSVILAEMPKPRNTENKVEIEKKIVNLNSIDQRLLNMNEDLFDAIAQNMASKNISGLDLDTNY